jgi:hypothetical protein
MRALRFFAMAALLTSCRRYDPVAAERIAALPEADPSPSELHRPGEPCLACHSTYQGSTPALALGGTVYSLDAMGTPVPAAGVAVLVDDSAGNSRSACTNSAGNFFVKSDDWADITFPLKVRAGKRAMRSIVGRDGSCASCHKLPSVSSLDPQTGAGRDSAGIVLVDLGDTDPTCGGGL